MLLKKFLSVLIISIIATTILYAKGSDNQYEKNLIILDGSLSSAEEYINEIEKIEILNLEEWPSTDNLEQWVMFRDQLNYYNSTKFKLIGDLWRNFPETEELETLMVERFAILPNLSYSAVYVNQSYDNDLQENIDWFIESFPDNNLGREQIHLGYHLMQVRANYQNDAELSRILFSYEQLEPQKSDSLKNLLTRVAQYLTEGTYKQSILKRIEDEFPDDEVDDNFIIHDSVGQPFTFRFNDFSSNRVIQSEDYLGKILVIDFWATWCKPCVDEIDYMKEIYEKYNSKGVEFIGISLDTNHDTLETFLQQEQIEWVQFFDGTGWDNSIANQYGVRSIPTVFIVNKEGLVVTIYGRGVIEDFLEELLIDG